MTAGWLWLLVVAVIYAPTAIDKVRRWDARLEERRQERDWAKWQRYVAQVVRREEDDTWASIERATGMDPTPIYAETWAHIFHHQLDDPEAVERFIGGAA